MKSKARADQPTHIFVRNLLDVPDDADQIYDMLGEKERLGLALSRIAQDVSNLTTHGCTKGTENAGRIDAVERIVTRTNGIVTGIGVSAAVITFLIGLYYFFSHIARAQ